MGIRTIQRKDKILDLIEKKGRVSMAALVSALGVSSVTARRYLEELQKEGLVQRVYGGAVKAEAGVLPGFSFGEKAARRQREKVAIARRAADLLEDGETVFFDTGTTVLELARLVGDGRKKLTVATNSLPAAMELLRNKNIDIMLIGGFLRRDFFDLFGPFSNAEIERFSFSRAFLGVDGLSARAGLTTTDQATARLEEAVIGRSDRVTVLVDSSKIGRVSLIPYGDFRQRSEIFTLVTDAGADSEQLNQFNRLGIEVLVA